jgi:hypothetical protein
MAERRIPRPDSDFAAYANHYSEAVHKFYEAQGLDVSELKPLEDALADWNKDFAAHNAAQARAEGARQEKDEARRTLEAAIRPVTAFVQGFPKTTDADRATIGITVRDAGGTPTSAPTSRPLARVESGQRLTHTLRFTDESTPTRKAKPRGVQGAEVWLALADPNTPAPPLGDSYKFLSLSSRGALQADFPSADAGKTAYYALRWVSTRGEKGPWSEVTSATVAA